MSEPLLRADELSRRFGGLVAVDRVSLSLSRGEIHALIGPNGAGKSTLANLLSGELKPTSGSIRLGESDVTGWSADRIARQGVARTFQHTNVFPAFSAFENCRLAAQARATGLPGMLRDADRHEEWNSVAHAALAATGLASRETILAGVLAHGERRGLEIAMALATAPSVLLLDEPLAGMGPEDVAGVIALLRGLRERHAMLLIEHDMDAVFALADRLTVMANGRVLASGAPEAIRANAEVQHAYLGTLDDVLP
ncbi:MAG: ABC transporter ATP-binding protein [Betaproteobacteria bacterium]